MDTATQIKTLEAVRDLIRIELNAKSLDEITHSIGGKDMHPDDNPINRLYTKIGDQIVSLKIREKVK